MLTDKIREEINLVALCQSEGVQLRRVGQNYVGRCPFHDEKTASFTVKDGRFKCFGCGSHGDAVDFIKDLRGLSFKATLAYLGIDTGRPLSIAVRRQVQVEIKERLKRQALLKNFRAWEAHYSSEVGRKIRQSRSWIKSNIKYEGDLVGWKGDVLSEIYNNLSTWEYQLEVFAIGSDSEKFALFKEVADV